MSRIHAALSIDERNALLEEVRGQLPAFLSAATDEHVDPAGDVAELLNLDPRDLARVVAVHVLLSDPVRRFVSALREGIRRPLTASERIREPSRAIRGAVDWGDTVRLRATSGHSAPTFVVRSATRVFDLPENRALLWVIDRLLAEAALATAWTADEGSLGPWRDEIRAMTQELQRAKRTTWLRSVPPVRPDGHAVRRLGAARTRFYRIDLPECLEIVERFRERPSAVDVVELLTQRYFVPTRDWQLFEVAVSLRIAKAMNTVAARRRASRLLVGVGRKPFAGYILGDGSRVNLWYQSWPRSMSESVHRTVRSRYSIGGGDLRPDIVVEHLVHGESKCIVLELKASRSGTYLAEGVGQLLSYLKDRPTALAERPNAWLVAPRSDAFKSVDSDTLEIWTVAAEDVGAAVQRRFLDSMATGGVSPAASHAS